jgi:DNA-binding NtrC family response regulator
MLGSRILLVEDDAAARFGITSFLEAHDYEVFSAESCQEGLDLFKTSRPDVVMHDYMLPDGNALDFLPRLKEVDSGTPIIILTGLGTIDLAVRAIKEGAEQFLTKPLELSSLLSILQRLIKSHRPKARQAPAKISVPRSTPDPFLGSSPAIRRLAEQAHRVLEIDSPVLIQGETGTGKGVLAAWLHNNGPRADEPFVDMNCAAFSRELLETELFGHERGAFTGAVANKMGLFEVAHRGTVFLDEIGDMDPQIQPKLLKVIEEKRFRRLGEVRDRLVDIRLIAASHHPLSQLVSQKKFRSDLYFRVSAIPITVPSLRDRPEDIPDLAKHLLEKIAANAGIGALSLTAEAENKLQRYQWPGNIRELRNVLERAVLLREGNILDRHDLRFEATAGSHEASEEWANLTLLQVEQRYIAKVLQEELGNVDRVAQRLNIPRSSLYQKIKNIRFSFRETSRASQLFRNPRTG